LFILHKEKDNILFLYSSQHQYPAAFYRSYTILKWIITIPWIAFLITFLPMYFYSPSSTFSLLLALEVSIQFALCCKYVLTVFVVDAKMALEYGKHYYTSNIVFFFIYPSFWFYLGKFLFT